MADDIDPALIPLSRQFPDSVFIDRSGVAVQWTSTCSTAPRCSPISREQEWTPLLYQAIAVNYAQMADSTYSYKQKIGYCCDAFGRGATTVKTAIKLFPEST